MSRSAYLSNPTNLTLSHTKIALERLKRIQDKILSFTSLNCNLMTPSFLLLLDQVVFEILILMSSQQNQTGYIVFLAVLDELQ